MATAKTAPTSDTQIDRETMSFGQYLNTLPKVKIKIHLPMEERQKLEALEASGKQVEWPSELIVLNGYRYQIHRGKEVEVPEPIAQIAKDAGLC
jgi:hypothetical protein